MARVASIELRARKRRTVDSTRGLLRVKLPRMICLVYAHPYPDRSRANRALLGAADGLPDCELRALYDLYPDFGIHVEAEQEALLRADTIIFQHPLYWYSVPGLLKHYFDKVLVRGFAYGEGGNALRGKRCLWVTTTGGEPSSYALDGAHGHSFAEFTAPIAQLARFCGMRFETPLIVHGAHKLAPNALHAETARYRERLQGFLQVAA